MADLWLVSYIVLWVIVAAIAVVLVLLVRQVGQIFLSTPEGVSRDGIAINEYAPSFVAEDLNGDEHTVGGPSERPKILIFGSPFCQPCRRLMPDLNQFARDFSQDLTILFISRGSYDATLRFYKDLDIAVPVLSGGGDVISDLYQARVTPFAFSVNTEGKIVRKGLVNNYEHLRWVAFGDGSQDPVPDQEATVKVD